MIRHVVFFSARDKADVAAIRAGLSVLGGIPDCDRIEISPNIKVDPISDAVDVVVYAEFKDEAALAAFKAHPLYAESTRVVRPLRELRFSADIVSGG